MTRFGRFIITKTMDGLDVVRPHTQKRHWKWVRLSILSTIDLTIIATSYFSAYFLRFDQLSFGGFQSLFWKSLPLVLVCNWAAYGFCGLYRQVWRFATATSAWAILQASILGSLLGLTFTSLFIAFPPRSIFILFGILSFLLLAIIRFSWRAILTMKWQIDDSARARCLIYGAGSGGDLLARHMAANPHFPYHAVGFVDDDPSKRHLKAHGLHILGTGTDLKRLCPELNIETVILAFPSSSGKTIREAVARCHDAQVKPLIMPDMASALGPEIFQPRAVDIKDLLRRAPQAVDHAKIRSFFTGKTVLITGAGGSIGSELCRQVLSHSPSRLIMLDVSEFSLYQIDTELRRKLPKEIELHPVLGSMLNKRFVESVFRDFSPQVVLHAAAYKHVPMVELNPIQGIWNNLEGTRLLAETAIRHKVERFLLISSDKAVRPTNVMGATKRCCELLVQSLHAQHISEPDATRFCAVRFGNVLGSSGSVIPLFIQQIQTGGPVTVTHPDINRFFMLADEAVGLVLQSIAMSAGGEIFILDMGEPVKIADMAVQLIRLAGKEPGKDIELVYTGLRPGEKLYEELILEGAEDRTIHDNIFVTRPKTHDAAKTLASLEELLTLARDDQQQRCVALLHELAKDPNNN